MGDGIKAKMINGLAWTSVNVFGMQAVQLVIGIFLARILIVDDFGKIGILFFFVGLSTVLIDGGFGQALLRKKDITSSDYSTFFYLNIATSVMLYLLLYAAAPFISSFFNEPELTDIARVLFLSVLLFSLYFVQHVSLLKKLDYKSVAIINISAVAISGLVALLLAFWNYGVWVLVYQQLSFHLVKVLLYPVFHKWRPIAAFSVDVIRQNMRFSVGIFLQTALNVIFTNIYTLLIAKLYSIKSTGYYTQANKYSETVNTISNSILTAGTYPVFAQIQDDKERLLRVYRTLITSVTLLIFPLIFFLIAVAQPLIVTIITDKWLLSVPFFQLLLAANLFQSVYSVNINILNARGQSRDTLKLEISKKSLIVFSILGCYQLGIAEMLIGLLIANFISFALSMRLIKNAFTHYYRHQILDLLRTLIMSAVLATAIYPLTFLNFPSYLIVLLQSVLFFVLYLAGVYFLFPAKWQEALAFLIEKLGGRASMKKQ